MNYEEKIARLEAARAAVEAAKAACEAAGVSMAVLTELAQNIDERATSAERQRLPIEIGGWVEIGDGRGWARWKIAAVGTKWLTIGGAKFDRDRGEMQGGTGYGHHIHPDDLARINRDLPPRRAKGAEVNRG